MVSNLHCFQSSETFRGPQSHLSPGTILALGGPDHFILTVSITSASSERSFSKLKLIKTVMRSMMKQERLKDGCERDLTDSINLDKLVDPNRNIKRSVYCEYG